MITTTLVLAVTRWDYVRPSADTDPRVNTPNDPEYDRAEPDDQDGDYMPNTYTVFQEDHRLFGFAPNETRSSVFYLDPSNPRFGQPQISGVSADTAWKLSIGDQSVEESTNVFRQTPGRLRFP